MKRHIRSLALLLLVFAVVPALAQPPVEAPGPAEPLPGVEPRPEGPPEPAGLPGSLEEMVEIGLHNNPDVRLAQVGVEQAAAELAQVRQGVVREISEAFHERMALEVEIDGWHRQVEALEKEVKKGLAPQEELDEVQAAGHMQHVEMARLDAQLRYLLGLFPGGEARPPEGEGRDTAARERQLMPRPALPELWVKLLEQPCSLDFEEEELKDVLGFLSDYLGINFLCGEEVGLRRVSVRLQDASLSSVLTALAEMMNGDICFVVRDYGLLATFADQARFMPGPAIPPYVPYAGGPVR